MHNNGFVISSPALDFSEIGDYLGIIIPIAIASSSATLM
jgi:hypothetical protein